MRSNNMEYTLAKPTADEYHAVSALKGAAFAEKNFCFGMCCGEEGIKLRTEAFTKWESSNPAKLDHLRVVRGGDGEILGACQLQIGDDPGDAELESVGTSTDRFERQPFNIQHSISFFYFSHFLPSFVRTSDQHVTKYVRLFLMTVSMQPFGKGMGHQLSDGEAYVEWIACAPGEGPPHLLEDAARILSVSHGIPHDAPHRILSMQYSAAHSIFTLTLIQS